MKIPVHRRPKKATYGKGKRIEGQFATDLQALKNRKLIQDFRKSKWHGELDMSGVDALVTRLDGVEIKINVTTTNKKTVKRHGDTNKRLGRTGIFIWSYDENLNRELRLQNLWRAINKFNPQK